MNKATRVPYNIDLSSGWFYIAIILLAGISAYANSFAVPMQFDDFTTIGAAFTNYSKGGFGLSSPDASRWVADLTFAFNRYIHGSQVGGYHFLNLYFHLSAALVVYGLLNLLIETCVSITSGDSQASFFARFVPFGAALLFVCHPIQTEAVTYIAQRYTSLAALFYLFSLYSYIRARRAMVLYPESPLFPKRMSWWMVFAFSAILAMKSKQTSITLPVMAAMLEGTCFRGYLLKKPAFIILIIGLLIIVPIQEFYSHNSDTSQSISQILQQASSETSTISRYSYFLTEQRVEMTYLRLLLFPVNQNLDYDYPLFTSIKAWPVFTSLILHLLLFGLALFHLVRPKRTSNNNGLTTETAMRLVGIGIVWFYLTLSIESSLIPIRDVIFEHRLYLPSVGFFIAVTSGVGWLASKRKWLQRGAWCSIAMFALILTASTIIRNKVWSSEFSMWQDVLEKSPNKARVRSYAGLHFAKHMMLNEAVQNLVRAVELDQANDRYRIYLNHTVAMIAGFEKRSSNGRKYQTETELVDPALIGPWLAVSFNNLGLAYEVLNNPDKAKSNYYNAIGENPDLDIAWYNLALLAAKNNNSEGYRQAYNKLALLNPELLRSLQELTTHTP